MHNLALRRDYNAFVKRKEAAHEARVKQQALFDKKLVQEEAWIRQWIQARRTRNEGRVRALKEMRRNRTERRKETSQVRTDMILGTFVGDASGVLKLAFEQL